MIQTPRDVPDYPGPDLRAAAAASGVSASPLGDNEPCPILFRDAGPDGLAAFFDGRLSSLAAPGSPLLFLHAAGAPPPSRAAEEFGELILLQPMVLRPWRTESAGIYLASGDAIAPRDSIGFVPSGADLHALSSAAASISHMAEFRGVLADYDGLCRDGKERVRTYVEERAKVENFAAPLRRLLRNDPEGARQRGFTEEELFAPWFSFDPERRREILDRISRAHLG